MEWMGALDWMAVKAWLANASLHQDALHIYAAVGIQVGAAFLLRRSLASWLPWLVVLGAGMVNEVLDIHFGHEMTVQPWQVAEAIKDMANTMLMPTLLLALVRFAPPRLFEKSRPRQQRQL